MSVLAPEGSPAPLVPAEAAPAATSAPSGLRTSHVAGGGFGAVVGAAAAALLTHYGIHVSDMDASMIGSTAVSAGVGFGHIVATVGLVPAFRKAVLGR